MPQPEGFPTAAIEPAGAYYDQTFGEFMLPYEVVRSAADPATELLAFIRSTYAAGATLAGWDRVNLERG